MAGSPKKRAHRERQRREQAAPQGQEPTEPPQERSSPKRSSRATRGHGSQQRYDDTTRQRALAIADEHGAAEAARQTGVAAGTIRRWRHDAGRAGPPAEVDPAAWAERKREAAHETWTAAREALDRVRELLARGDGRSERDAKDAALTLAILLDKSAALEQASALADEHAIKLAEAQAEAIGEALVAVFEDLDLPRIDAIREVIAHRLRPLSDPDAPEGPAPNTDEAREALRASLRDEVRRELREEVRQEVREELRREEWNVKPSDPVAELPAGDDGDEPAEPVQGEIVSDREDEASDSDAKSSKRTRRRQIGPGLWTGPDTGPTRIGPDV